LKYKKYWKIIISLFAILLLAVFFISNVEITGVNNDAKLQANVEDDDGLQEENNEEEAFKEEIKDSTLDKAKLEENENESKTNESDIKSNENISNSNNQSQSNASDGTTATYSKNENIENRNEQQQIEPKEYYSFSIDCYTVLNNMGDLRKGKEGCLGNNGVIFSGQVEGKEGMTVKQLLMQVCKNNDIKVIFRGDYVVGINNLNEKDCGQLSGWMYSVNGVFPMASVAQYKIRKNDVIKFRYTCKSYGKDLM